MDSCVITRALLTEHYKRYPQMQISDIFKFIFQSSFGCEHMVASEELAINNIKREYAEMITERALLVEKLDGDYSRVDLSYLDKGLSAEALGKLFCLSANIERDGAEKLAKKLMAARSLVSEGVLPFALEDFEKELSRWSSDGYPAVHHSDSFRKAYKPAYRVIANKYTVFLPLFAEIDKRLAVGEVVLAIDGGSASGKTTLSKLLENIYDCNVFHMDDFFLRPEQRSAERLLEVGGNVDRERFFEEVLLPTSRRETVSYRRFDCSTQALLEPKTVEPKRLTVVEGAYSMHKELAPYFDLSVFLDISEDHQKERVLERNGAALAKRFFEEWIPLENIYFSNTDIRSRCTLSVKIEKN